MREFNNPIDVAVGLIPVRRLSQIMLAGIIRGKKADAGYGKPALVGGFVNAGESIEEAVAREAREEIGFDSESADWHLMHSRHVAGPNLNLVFCLYPEVVEIDILEKVPPSEEVTATTYLDATSSLAFPLHEEAVQLYYRKYLPELRILRKYR